MKLTTETVNEMLVEMSARESQPDVIFISPAFRTAYTVHMKFAGRNWRRIKRELRKAMDAMKRGDINRTAPAMWRA